MAYFSGGDLLKKALAKISGKSKGSVNVGFLAGATYPDGASVAQVAFWNEYGTTTAPSRPFFRTMIAKESPGWGVLMMKAMKHYGYDGQVTMQFMGVKLSEELQQSIVSWQDPPNAPATVRMKGFNKPLIHTSHMQNSVDFEVKPK
jgi:hypothetical protein